MWQLGRSLNIELTTKCALKCLRCERTFRGKSLELHELSLELIQKRLTAEALSGVQAIDFSGNFGDAIYHSKFLEIVRYFKSLGKNIYIETNGSGRPVEWWQSVVSLLDKKDWIVFSIDGLEDTNHLYRVGSRWSSVMDAVNVCGPAPVGLTWKSVVFKHNEHQLENIKKVATEKNFNRFVIVRSNRFKKSDEEDSLRPSPQNVAQNIKKDYVPNKVKPKCQNLPLFFISASAHLYPCCWSEVANVFGSSEFVENKDNLSLETYSVEQILNSEFMVHLSKSFENSPFKLCVSACPREKSDTPSVRSYYNKEEFRLNV